MGVLFLPVLGLAALLGPPPPGSSPDCRKQAFFIMGTVATLEACGAQETKLNEVIALAYREIESVDLLMSLYRPESELSRVNRTEGSVPVSQSTLDVLEEALYIAEASRGAFDPTVGPLSRAWGFVRGEPEVPGSGELAENRARVGFRWIRLDRQAGTVSRTHQEVEIDLGGIAKGYAVDRALSVLQRAGLSKAVVDLGESSVCFFDQGDSATLFRIRNSSSSPTTFPMQAGCVATSGGDQQSFQVEGESFSHIIDPRTGWPVRDSVSATVLGRTGEAMRVDALSTAGFVMGPDGAIDLWQRFGVEGILYYRSGREIQSVRTSGFPDTP